MHKIKGTKSFIARTSVTPPKPKQVKCLRDVNNTITTPEHDKRMKWMRLKWSFRAGGLLAWNVHAQPQGKHTVLFTAPFFLLSFSKALIKTVCFPPCEMGPKKTARGPAAPSNYPTVCLSLFICLIKTSVQRYSNISSWCEGERLYSPTAGHGRSARRSWV